MPHNPMLETECIRCLQLVSTPFMYNTDFCKVCIEQIAEGSKVFETQIPVSNVPTLDTVRGSKMYIVR